jgi:imidazolonepropionase-like amidohydrolase
MASLLLKNARIFDGESSQCPEGMWVRIADGLIQEITQSPIAVPDNTQVIDVAGRTLMPGMIDAHVHAFASDVSVQKIDNLGESYRAVHAVRMLKHALACGFTSVRDVGGGNYGMFKALEDHLFEGPRYFYSGKVLSMTGGHGDFRQIYETPRYQSICACSGAGLNALAVMADGVDECLRAVREEFRQGAHCIKIMGSGGVLSPTDPVWMNQYREDEIRAIVNECVERRSYATAHCHPASAIRRCVDFGVRTIEHGTLIDAETATFVAQQGAYIVPTMVIIDQLVREGRKLGFPPASQEKVETTATSAISGLDIMRKAGVKVCFGTDLLGSLYADQCREFTLRQEVFSPVEILRQATSVTAEMMMLKGKIGCITVGAHADMLIVDGDPLADISLLAQDGRTLPTIIRAGTIVKNELH